MRSSSPEYDDVISSSNSDDDDAYSEEIPIKIERLKSTDKDVLNRDNDVAVLFDDSESDEFSLPQVDWACVNSQSSVEDQMNTDEAVPLGDDADGADTKRLFSSAEPDVVSRCQVNNSAVTLNATDVVKSDHYVEGSECDTSLSDGLTFNIVNVRHLEEESTLLHEGNDAAEETAEHSTSRLSRKRSRVSRNESREQAQCKRLRHNVDDISTAYGDVAEAMLPTVLRDDTRRDAADLLPSHDNLLTESSSELSSVSRPVSSATETTVISSTLSQDCDASFSQGM